MEGTPNVSLAQQMMQVIEKEDENSRKNGASIIEKAKDDKQQKELERVQFANSFNEFYEYDVVSVIRNMGL